ncbi:hypothetical protein ACWNT8_05715 [Pigmentibacter ruber]
MLFSLDNFLQLNLSNDVFPFMIVFYWIICGAIVQSFFIKIDKYIPNSNFCHTIETSITRRLFYFICGGAILPMLFALLPPIFALGYLGKIIEEKEYRKKT